MSDQTPQQDPMCTCALGKMEPALAHNRNCAVTRWLLTHPFRELPDSVTCKCGHPYATGLTDDGLPEGCTEEMCQYDPEPAITPSEGQQDLSRCSICGWPLDHEGKMCREKNCSMRPWPERVYDRERAVAIYGKELIDRKYPAPVSLSVGEPQQAKEWHEEQLGKVIIERDWAEGKITEIAESLGCEEEWSNLHSHWECVPEAVSELQDRLSSLVKVAREFLDGLQSTGNWPKAQEKALRAALEGK